MNNKETILAGIHLKKTRRPPVMILSGGVWANKQFGLSLQDSFEIPPQTMLQMLDLRLEY